MVGEDIEKLIEDKFGRSKLGSTADALGISRAYMSDICNGKRGLSSEVAVKLSRLFGGDIGRDLFVKQAHAEYEAARKEAKQKQPMTRKNQ